MLDQGLRMKYFTASRKMPLLRFWRRCTEWLLTRRNIKWTLTRLENQIWFYSYLSKVVQLPELTFQANYFLSEMEWVVLRETAS